MALTKVTGQVIKNTTDVTVGVLTVTNTLAVGGTVSIGGTLTYEDVTNVDAVGLITARNGIVVGSGITLSKDGDGFFTGIVTATTFSGSFTGSGANLTNIPAGQLFGTLPALNGSNLTGIVGGKFNGPAAGILTTSTVGIQTADVTSADLVGAATSMVGLYIGDGHLLFSNYLNKSGGYYITTGLNALNAGPVTLGTSMTLDGTWTIV